MEIKMPKLGESVHEGTIEQWLVSVGDTVEEYDPICEVITDKVTAEVPSSYTGTIKEITVNEGETVSVGEIICHMDVEGESSDNTSEEVSSNEQPQNDTKQFTENSLDNKQDENAPKNNGRYSPVVFKLASENEINLSQVVGTGFEGRVTKKDIEKAIKEGTAKESSHYVNAKTPPVNTPTTIGTQEPGSSIPVNGVRKQIAQNMVNSVNEIPHAWMMIEADATNLVKTRNHHKDSFKNKEGYNLTFFAFFVKAVAESLKAYPLLNSSWQNDEIVIHKDVNISIAVADEDKLYVPVIKNADEKSIKGIAREINDLAQKARYKKLRSEDMQGGTFTVNNTGTFGSVSSMGIINHPQAAILQIESIVKKPVVIDDMIAIRNMVNLCLSIDHRILDGLQAGRFMNYVKTRIEQYAIETTSIF
ncbi:dihydrolipoamide acetyltransferase family protein [Staphylococcus kloosii]|jgi:2-oxoisovalerate dehydrogenase E2 component (dihydrolipoyl transacylase)|uniref:Dihydrolipoamide acetyltransferase component of pyruvate dehydrogenase complex n=1 Tax=Staphylococcus kloosii TaxID=29384 RepID=A0ABQ0XLA9_9STAP|nr:dihydrolipoamide acetyltransferase family protein [Staphylococcus kloosii]AVQ36133.1 2-oxo acid dehydrogenase subunit E2 [Staphylococcus kloosii]PNZ06792.1 2-oxoglutarate dehydrogenase [Staphylococcus kloosii]PTJ74010.1 2-oxo acid dehydrogenase subunit E2 [Staphylococcus kloosii]SUM49212.1 lipoamide acyltransferase component of branched-chain alpha-keto acid dehydrogenase complex [Staphylococcus kloosii]GEP81643.1 dihydrolipoamide acetyltransferase component of pyruvate dehydrogenase comple